MTDHKSSPVATVTSAQVVTDLPNVDLALSNLYRTADELADTGAAPVIRALLANVIVYACTDEEADEAADAISETSGTHPCRAIILRTGDSTGATVSAVCGITERGDRRLCGEIIRLRAPAGSDATGLVLPLLAPDVPVHLWTPSGTVFRDFGTRNTETPFLELTRIADQVIVDSRRFRDLRAGLGAVTGICRERGHSCVAHDLSWISLLAWRELTAQHFDPPVFRDQLDQIRQITVRFSPGEREDIPPSAPLLLASWLIARTGILVATARNHKRGEMVLEAHRNGAGVDVKLRPEEAPGAPGAVSSITIRCGADAGLATFVTKSQATGELSATEDCPGLCLPPQVLEMPPQSEPALLAQALDETGPDTVYEEAARVACEILDLTVAG